MSPFNISINLSAVSDFFSTLFNLNPIQVVLLFLVYGGWIIVLIFLWHPLEEFWLKYIQGKFSEKQRFILLSISVPKNNEQGPEAVERLFSNMSGIGSKPNWYDKYVEGKFQLSMSFELISVGGQIQYLIHTPVQWRSMIESAIYASYPDAEVKEIDDYTKNGPEEFPSTEWRMKGADLILYAPNPYPIRTYPAFEHPLTGEIKDPLAHLLEFLTTLTTGEQFWLQIIAKPTGSSWKKEGEALVTELMAKKQAKKVTSEDEGATFIQMSPGQRRIVDSIEMKIAKTGFDVKIRFIYLAKAEVFNPGKGVAGFLGALNQFNTLDMNGFKTHNSFKVGTYYIFKKHRTNKISNRILSAYRERSSWQGGPTCVLNIEELASIYHFPVITVGAPLIKKTSSKKAEPPFNLPRAS